MDTREYSGPMHLNIGSEIKKGEKMAAVTKEFIDKVTKELVDRGLLIEAGWAGYKLSVLSPNAGDVQITETRLAFFAGAQHLFSSIMSALDSGDEPTEADLERMDKINNELARFLEEIKSKVRLSQ